MDFKSIEKLCLGCLGEMNENERYCSQCGFDNEQPKEPHHLAPRTILAGKYLVGKVLGEGGFGITYLGFDLNLNIKVAIKEYFPSGFVARSGNGATVTPFTGSSADYYGNGIEKFLNEARSLARFHNLDGIVEVRDFFRENGTAYIVMEFVEGENLRTALERRGGKIPAAEVMALMMPLVSSLAKVHQTGLVHRDISPDNIMLTPDGRLKLLDFGAARDVAGSKSVSVVLKPGYAPEEQYRTHGELGAWTDIYALCGTMYKLITGVTPPESIERLAGDTLQAPSHLGVSMNPAQEAAILRGLSVRKEGRFVTTGELYAALYGGAAQTVPGTFAPQAQATYAPPQQGGASYTPQGQYTPPATNQWMSGGQSGFAKLWQEKKGLLIAGFGGVALIVILLVVLLTKGNGSTPANVDVLASPSATVPAATQNLPAANEATPSPESTMPADYVALIDPSKFFEQSPKTVQTTDGTEYTYTGMDSFMAINYISLLISEGYDVDVIAENGVLFTITQGNAVVTFEVGDDVFSMTMICPSTVALVLSDAPVTQHYLDNNGLTIDQWIDLGSTSAYSYSGRNYMGNSNANNQNYSEVALQGDILYVADNNTHSGIYSVDWTTGNTITQLTDDTRYLCNLNVVGRYLYYTSVEGSGDNRSYYMYRVPVDGSAQPEIFIFDAKNIITYGDYAYYKDADVDALIRCNLSSPSMEYVLSEAGYFQNIVGGRIYCADSGSSTGIYSYALDGSDETFVFDADCYSMTVHGGWIYYLTSADKGSRLRRVDLDGEGDELLIDEAIHTFCVNAGSIYYSTEDDYVLKCYDTYNGSTEQLASYGKFPTLIESATDISLFFNDESGNLCHYNFNNGTGTPIDLS